MYVIYTYIFFVFVNFQFNTFIPFCLIGYGAIASIQINYIKGKWKSFESCPFTWPMNVNHINLYDISLRPLSGRKFLQDNRMEHSCWFNEKCGGWKWKYGGCLYSKPFVQSISVLKRPWKGTWLSHPWVPPCAIRTTTQFKDNWEGICEFWIVLLWVEPYIIKVIISYGGEKNRNKNNWLSLKRWWGQVYSIGNNWCPRFIFDWPITFLS